MFLYIASYTMGDRVNSNKGNNWDWNQDRITKKSFRNASKKKKWRTQDGQVGLGIGRM